MKSESKSLSGKVALVTGGAGILGHKFCHALAAQGADVVIADLMGPKAQELATKLQTEFAVKAKFVECNVGDPQSVAQLVSSVEKEFGKIDILVNNAATKGADLNDFFTPFEDFKLETWREIMSINLDGVFLVAQAVGKSMLKNHVSGSIIQTASIYGVVAPDQRIYEGSKYMDRAINSPAVYSASKAGVIGLTKYLAAYWGSKGIRVNTLTPGGVASGQNDVFQQKYSARVPMGRMANSDELCGALIFLASDASSYVTGQNLIVDGGLTAW
jgi:NAD(P)-dependent dehydrogenase (short-subunit alcohol dehydrogenase family)